MYDLVYAMVCNPDLKVEYYLLHRACHGISVHWNLGAFVHQGNSCSGHIFAPIGFSSS
jgi:hypothetical protein